MVEHQLVSIITPSTKDIVFTMSKVAGKNEWDWYLNEGDHKLCQWHHGGTIFTFYHILQ